MSDNRNAGETGAPALLGNTVYVPVTTGFVQTVEVPIAPIVTRLDVPPDWFRDAVRGDPA
jgi:hypothetical protein